MVRINEARSSPVGAIGLQFQADFNNSIGNRHGPLGVPVEKLIEHFFQAYYNALNDGDLSAFSAAPQTVLIAAATFSRTYLVNYIRPGSVTNIVYLERYSRDHMNDVWPGALKRKFTRGWTDKQFIEKLLGVFVSVADDCDLL